MKQGYNSKLAIYTTNFPPIQDAHMLRRSICPSLDTMATDICHDSANPDLFGFLFYSLHWQVLYGSMPHISFHSADECSLQTSPQTVTVSSFSLYSV